MPLDNFLTYDPFILPTSLIETLKAKNKLQSKLNCLKKGKNMLKTLFFSRKIDIESALIFSRSEMRYVFVV